MNLTIRHLKNDETKIKELKNLGFKQASLSVQKENYASKILYFIFQNYLLSRRKA